MKQFIIGAEINLKIDSYWPCNATVQIGYLKNKFPICCQPGQTIWLMFNWSNKHLGYWGVYFLIQQYNKR